jgi:hypothetical protein
MAQEASPVTDMTVRAVVASTGLAATKADNINGKVKGIGGGRNQTIYFILI